ncbi:hypothetical protein ZOD2009_12972 [Haladaptatus paucihalophilus DX253]|uniref:Uncharacterized protein n=1 Tax=Haladaptatus paucihalophilus DX253 TaxID=797209 RepID=E7QUV9_HALPU|nr:hypothetical protein ZOD2009_12972 [Haladaptatus paucihalophilus DX253]
MVLEVGSPTTSLYRLLRGNSAVAPETESGR